MTKNVVLVVVIALCLAALVYISVGSDEVGPPALPLDVPSSGSKPDMPAGHPSANGPGDEMAAPDFTATDLNGQKVSLSQFRGKVVLVNFWSSTCGPCIMEMPSLEKLHQKMQGKPFELLTVTADTRQMAARAKEELNINVPILIDSTGDIAMLYSVYMTPETYIIAPDGTVDNMVIGAANWADGSVIDYLDNLISKHSTAKEPEQKDE